MPSAPPAANRLSLLGCLAIAAALALSACGDGAATAEDKAGALPKSSATAGAEPRHGADASARSSQPCPAKLGAFVGVLERLRHQLAVGLSYEQYAARIDALQASYGAIPVDHLTIDCLIRTGTPAEHALNRYIDAANAWGECLADAACTIASIEPALQRKWRAASRLLSEAR